MNQEKDMKENDGQGLKQCPAKTLIEDHETQCNKILGHWGQHEAIISEPFAGLIVWGYDNGWETEAEWDL